MRGRWPRVGRVSRRWIRLPLSPLLHSLAGLELELTAGSPALHALGPRVDIEVFQLDRLRASGILLGDPADLMLEALQLTLAHKDLVRISVNGEEALIEELSKT